MALVEKIEEDIKIAMKAKDKDTLEAIRAVKAELLLLKTANANHTISEQDEIKILQKLISQRKDAATIYKEQNREELYNQEMFQVSVIEKYLPAQMSDEELNAILRQIIAQTGASKPQDMGKVMGLASKQLAGKADNKRVSEIIKSLLSE